MKNKGSVKTKLVINSTHLIVLAGILSLLVVMAVIIWSKAFLGDANKVVSYTQGLHQVARGAKTTDPLVTIASATPKVLESDPILGGAEAKVTIINFSDYLCTHCGTVENTLRDLVNLYPQDARLVWKDAPVDQGESYQAALAGRCAQAQDKFWEMHNLLFDNQISLSPQVYSRLARDIGLNVDQFNNCLTSRELAAYVDQSVAQADQMAITEIPYLYINDMEFVGLGTLEDFKVVVDYLLGEDKNQSLEE